MISNVTNTLHRNRIDRASIKPLEAKTAKTGIKKKGLFDISNTKTPKAGAIKSKQPETLKKKIPDIEIMHTSNVSLMRTDAIDHSVLRPSFRVYHDDEKVEQFFKEPAFIPDIIPLRQGIYSCIHFKIDLLAVEPFDSSCLDF
jgi:hypothetical protein